MTRLDWEKASAREAARPEPKQVVAWWWTPAVHPSECAECRFVTPRGSLVAWNHGLRASKCEVCGAKHAPQLSKRAMTQPRVGGAIKAPSPREVLRKRTPAGAWSAKQLSEWGVPWPPPKGWRKKLKAQWERENGR